MEKRELLILQAIAVFCVYLITSTTFVAALQINIFTSPSSQSIQANMADFSDLIQETFGYPYSQNFQYVQIQLTSKNPAAVMKKIYLFRCKGLDPVDCIKNGIQPAISANSGSLGIAFDETYRWDDVSSGNVGNFLTMVKLDIGGNEVWTGSWDKITKTGIKTFNQLYYKSDPIDLYVKAGVSADAVKTYIETFAAIPSDNMNRTVFSTLAGNGVARMHDLFGSRDKIDPAGTGVPTFYAGNLSGNVFNKSLGMWDMVFASNDKIANPIVFYSTAAGPGNFTGGGKLVVDNWSPQVVMCGSSDVINVNLHAENASVGYFLTYYYTLGGMKAGDGAMTCSIANPNASIYYYQCSIPASTLPVCNAPGTSTVSVYFNYQGGVSLTSGFPITFKAPVPRLTIASLSPTPFDCGIDKWMTANLQVSNPSTESLKKYYAFDGKNFKDLKNCTGSGTSFSCSLNESSICQLLQENLELTFKFVYGSTEVLSLPADVMVTFPPPSMGIDTVTPQSVTSGNTTTLNVLLHVNYPDFLTYNVNSFNYKYLDKDFAPATCSLQASYSNVKYYKCAASLAIPSGQQGVETLAFRLDGYQDSSLKQLYANSFIQINLPPAQPTLTIISASPSPLSCIQDPAITLVARADGAQGTPTTQYSIDGGTSYKALSCAPSGTTYACTVPKDELCGLMKNSFAVMLKFAFPSVELVSNPQNVYVTLPEPHMQVYAVMPDTLAIGQTTSATVSLFVQYPAMVGSNPVFLYSYLDKTNQRLSCSKVSSTSNKDFYECASTQFALPDGYSKSTVPVIFTIQGTTISFPLVLAAAAATSIDPWLEIVSSTPSTIEVNQGNETSASFYVTIHNAAQNDLKHTATLIPNSWITAGTCSEAAVQYDFRCDVTIKALRTAKAGANPASLTLRMTDKKTYDLTNTTSVYVIPEEATVDVQSVTPATLYCEGQKQTNPDTVKITATTKNIASSSLLEESITFNGKAIVHSAKYCTQQGQSITCSIPTDKLFEKVNCGSGDLVPGGGTHYYPLALSFLVRTGDTTATLFGTEDVAIVARPLEAYLEISDNNVVNGLLQTKINCLGAQSIKLGSTGYVRINNADLLHPEAKDDLKWAFTLDAQDNSGKLTRGMGVSPAANATVCKYLNYQKVGSHRIEDYECTLYVDYNLFQRCAAGEGDIVLTATSATGQKADGKIDVVIIKDDSRYQFDFDILTKPAKDIDCQVQSYGKGAQCSLASDSNQNVTVRIFNNNAAVGLDDLVLYEFDVKLQKGAVDANERSLGNCIRDSKESTKYLCPFQISPVVRLPETDEFNVTKSSNQTNLPSISLGSLNVTLYVKYANGLEQKALSKLDGTITIHPKKTDSMINAEKILEKMRKTFDSFMGIFKWVVTILSFCAVCVAGNAVTDSMIKNGQKWKGSSQIAKVGTGGTKPISSPTDCPTCVKAGNLWCLGECFSQDQVDVQEGISSYCSKSCTQTSTPGTPTTGNWYYCRDGNSKMVCTQEFSVCYDEANGPFPSSSQCLAAISSLGGTGYIVAGAPAITGAQVTGAQPAAPASTGDSSDASGIIGSLAISVGLVLTVLLLMKGMNMGGDVDKEKNDIMDNMKQGIKWGFAVCVVPRIVGELGGWITKKADKEDTGWATGFSKVKAFGSAMGDVCKMLLGLMPMIMNFINFYIGYLRFETCMQMAEAQVEAGATASGSMGAAYQAQTEAQTAMSTTSSMMTCFNDFMTSLNQLSQNMAYMGNYFGTMGGTQTYVKVFQVINGKSIQLDPSGGTICGGETLVVLANMCKGGVASQSVTIQGTGTGCECKQQATSQTQCNYNVPLTQSYGSYPVQGVGGTYGTPTNYGFTGSSGGMQCTVALSKCQDGKAITIIATGAGTVEPITFTYKKTC
jgi:hypothetical protein